MLAGNNSSWIWKVVLNLLKKWAELSLREHECHFCLVLQQDSNFGRLPIGILNFVQPKLFSWLQEHHRSSCMFFFLFRSYTLLLALDAIETRFYEVLYEKNVSKIASSFIRYAPLCFSMASAFFLKSCTSMNSLTLLLNLFSRYLRQA